MKMLIYLKWLKDYLKWLKDVSINIYWRNRDQYENEKAIKSLAFTFDALKSPAKNDTDDSGVHVIS